jgi:hypothetical protein
VEYFDSKDEDNMIGLVKWVKGKKAMSCPFGKKEPKKFDFDITKVDKIFDLLLPFIPPLWFAILVLQVVPEPVTVLSGPPHFDGKNYYMWQRQMSTFIRGKSQILWDVTENTTHVHLINFLSPRSREMHDTNNKVVNYLFRSGSRRGFGLQDLGKAQGCLLGTVRFRLNCLRLTRESTRTSLISPVSP